MKNTTGFTKHLIRYLIFLSMGVGVFAGCRSKDLMEGQTDTALFEQGQQYYDAKEYKKALEYFLYVKDHFVRSSYAGITRFYAGESYFAMEEYADAAIEYQSFLSFFPKDPKAPAAQYKLGLCHLEQSRGPDRDQTMINKAIQGFQTVLEKYPTDTEYVKKAEEQIQKVRNELALHEFVVGSFYRKEKLYPSSNHRLDYLIAEYPESEWIGEALFIKGLNYLDLEQPEAAKTTFLKLIQSYPESKHSSEARKKLANLGVTDIPKPPPPVVSKQETDLGSSPSTPPLTKDLQPSSPKGSVVLIRDTLIFTDLIRDDGIREGMVLSIYRENVLVGTIRITEIQDGFSVGQIESLTAGMTIQEQDHVCCPNAE